MERKGKQQGNRTNAFLALKEIISRTGIPVPGENIVRLPVFLSDKRKAIVTRNGTQQDVYALQIHQKSPLTKIWCLTREDVFLLSEVDDDIDQILEIATEVENDQEKLKEAQANLTEFLELRKRSPENIVSSFFFYMWNRWSKEECDCTFGPNAEHFWQKWLECYERMKGSYGASEEFYKVLSESNRKKLVQRAVRCYNGNRTRD